MILTKPVVNRKHLLKDPSDKIEREKKNTERNMKKVKKLIDIYLGILIYTHIYIHVSEFDTGEDYGYGSFFESYSLAYIQQACKSRGFCC